MNLSSSQLIDQAALLPVASGAALHTESGPLQYLCSRSCIVIVKHACAVTEPIRYGG
jgi:hypothetical protein